MEIIGCLFIKRILFAFDWLGKRCKEISCKFHCTNLVGTKQGFTTQFPHRALPLKAFFVLIHQHKNWSQISRLQTCQCIRHKPYFPRHHAHLHKTLLPINLTLFRVIFFSSIGLEAKNLIFEVYASDFIFKFLLLFELFLFLLVRLKTKIILDIINSNNEISPALFPFLGIGHAKELFAPAVWRGIEIEQE